MDQDLSYKASSTQRKYQLNLRFTNPNNNTVHHVWNKFDNIDYKSEYIGF